MTCIKTHSGIILFEKNGVTNKKTNLPSQLSTERYKTISAPRSRVTDFWKVFVKVFRDKGFHQISSCSAEIHSLHRKKGIRCCIVAMRRSWKSWSSSNILRTLNQTFQLEMHKHMARYLTWYTFQPYVSNCCNTLIIIIPKHAFDIETF